MMNNLKEDELEFISVHQEDDNAMNNVYVDHSQTDRDTSSNIGSWFFNQSKHPGAVFFHLFFKVLVLFLYVFGSWFTDNFIFIFVICIILLAFDFWTVKNISGRLLVGLRWWSHVKDDGSNEWTFESLEDMAEISAWDSRIFWWGMYLTPLAWTFYFVVGLLRLKFEYLPIVIAAIMLSMANIIGYMKCSNSASTKMQSLVENGMKGAAIGALAENSTLRSWVFNSLLAITANNNTSTNSNNSNNMSSV
jgi:hypothetical protein